MVDEVLQHLHPLGVNVVKRDGQVTAATHSLTLLDLELGKYFITMSFLTHGLLLVLDVAPVPEPGGVPAPHPEVGARGEGQEPEIGES